VIEKKAYFRTISTSEVIIVQTTRVVTKQLLISQLARKLSLSTAVPKDLLLRPVPSQFKTVHNFATDFSSIHFNIIALRPNE
jgi:hypothetical protein